MKRLTIRRDHGVTMAEGFDFHIEVEEYDLVQEILDRLAAYEDTGLEPDEIVAMRHTLDEYHKEADPLLRAKVEGRLAIIPEPSDGLEHDLLEPMKIGYALKSEIMKLNTRLARDPKSVCHLDYTIIAALQAVLEGGVNHDD